VTGPTSSRSRAAGPARPPVLAEFVDLARGSVAASLERRAGEA